MPPTNDFGSTLRKLRQEHGMTQRELSGRVGLDFTYLSKIETGALPPPSEAAISRFAVIFGVDEDDLFTQAHKIPLDLKKTLEERPADATYIVRHLKHASDAQLEAMADILEPTVE